MATRLEKERGVLGPLVLIGCVQVSVFMSECEDGFGVDVCWATTGPDQACRTISTGQLSALLRVHLRPIDVVVFHGSQGRPCFEVGFPLRCLQRLSLPHIATLLCRWRDNRSTRGASIPVLSY